MDQLLYHHIMRAKSIARKLANNNNNNNSDDNNREKNKIISSFFNSRGENCHFLNEYLLSQFLDCT